MRKRLNFAERVLKAVARRGGSGWTQDIWATDFNNHGYKSDWTAARENLAGLAEFQRTYNPRTRRPAERITLTVRGWAAAHAFDPAYKPVRLAAADLKAQIDEMAAQRDPWALGLQRDAADGYQWRRHEAERKAADREAERRRAAKEKPEPKHPSASRHRSEAELEQRAAWARSKGFKPAYDESDEEPERDEPAREQPAQTTQVSVVPTICWTPGGFCERCHMDDEYCRCQNPIPGRSSYAGGPISFQPTATDKPMNSSHERIKDKARRLGYGAAIMGDGIMYDNRKISFAEWDAKVCE